MIRAARFPGMSQAQRVLLGEKRCGRCDRVQPLEHFCLSRYTKDGHNNRCRTCDALKSAAYQPCRRKKDRLRKRALRLNADVRTREVAYTQRWRQAHPEQNASHWQRRRARKKQAPVNDMTVGQWQEIKAVYGYRCVYCGIKNVALTQDHLTPLSNGGSHTATNIVPACVSCNSKKGTGPVLKPIQPLLLLATSH
jgi:5-methylcytosine-specific restriction endonuclease McrA